jgi:cytoskeletal protein CcmA (bactofilin family)
VVALLAVVLVLVSVVPATAAGASRAGGTVTVEEGERVDGDLEAFGGNVVIHGTVDGDLDAFAGNVQILGEVTGDVEAAAGNVVVSGTVGGNVSAAGGNVQLGPNAAVGGTFEAGAETVTIQGDVGGAARVGARQVVVGPGASIAGDLEYDGELTQAPGATVGGEVTRNPDLEVGGGPSVPVVPGYVFDVFFVVTTLLLGALVLLVFPRFSRGLAERTETRPGLTALAGVSVLVATPFALLLVAVTVVGIPFALAGVALYLLAIWLGIVYGRYVLGAWLLGLVDRDNRWAALVLGVLSMAVLTQIPIVGGLLDLLVLIGGLGALALGTVSAYRNRRSPGTQYRRTATDTGDADGAGPD